MDRLLYALGTGLAAGVAGLIGAFWTIRDTSNPAFWIMVAVIAGVGFTVGAVTGDTEARTS